MRTKINKTSQSGFLRNQTGHTLVELAITLIMSGIMLAGISVIVSGSHDFIIKGRKKINLQQDFSLIQQILATNIRQGNYGQQEIYADYADYLAEEPTQSSGSCLKLYFPSGDSTVLYKENSDFKIEHSNGTITNLVQGIVDSLVFTEADTNSIQTAFSLSQDNYSIADVISYTFRNYELEPATDILRPIGVGTWSNNTEVGDTPEWACVDEVSPDGNVTYVYPTFEDEWRTDSYDTDDGSGIGTVDSVLLNIRIRGLGAISNQARTVVLLSGTRYYGTIIDLGGMSSYFDSQTTYTTNPATSSAWSWAEIDAMEIGVRLYTPASTPQNDRARCTQVWAEVYYTP